MARRQTLTDQMLSEVVLFHFVPVSRAQLLTGLKKAGYPKFGFGGYEYLAMYRPARADLDALPSDITAKCIAALSDGEPQTASDLCREYYSQFETEAA